MGTKFRTPQYKTIKALKTTRFQGFCSFVSKKSWFFDVSPNEKRNNPMPNA